jgi:hypothetical protein
MKKLKGNSGLWGIALLAQVLFVFFRGFDVPSLIAQVRPATRIVHTPVRFFIAGFRIKVNAQVSDEAGINIVRCYFRAKGEADYVFVDMPLAAGNEYAGVLPAPSSTTQAIEYILLAVNNGRVVVRSQTFTVYKTEGTTPPEWQNVNANTQITVKTELAQAPQVVQGFTDDIVSDVVESAFRFGYVAEGIYILSQMASVAPLGAVSGGTITATSSAAVTAGTTAAAMTGVTTATTGGISIGTVALIGAGVAVAGVGIYKIATINKLTPSSIVGTYGYSGLARGNTLTGTITFQEGGNLTYNAQQSEISSARSGTGWWTLASGNLTIHDNVENWEISGNAEGNKKSFTLSGTAGTYTFTRQ